MKKPPLASKKSISAGSGRAIAEISLKNLVSNYQAISKLVPDQEILPMIKADAYGHGAGPVGKALCKLPNLYGLGVATLAEGKKLRPFIRTRVPILVFSGASPWTDSVGRICQRYGLTPVIFNREDWERFEKGGWTRKLPYELKFNTGMNRLGIPLTDAQRVFQTLDAKDERHAPRGILSHLALGEDPSHPVSKTQLQNFEFLVRIFRNRFSQTRFHLANSAAIWNHRAWKLGELTTVVRPGLSLYGVPPWKNANPNGITQAMKVRSPIISLREIKPGESVGYGAKFVVSKRSKESVPIAILPVGYGDGLHRYLSGRGHVAIGGKKEKILGVISMDLTAVSCKASTRMGTQAEWWGPSIEPWEQAEAAGTIPYELMTSLTDRVEKVYV